MRIDVAGMGKKTVQKSARNIFLRTLLPLPALAMLLFPAALPAIEGLSNEGNIAPWAYNLKPGYFEFEPEIDYSTFDHYIDDSGKPVPAKGRYQLTEVNFRITAGISERVEMGAVFGMETESFDSYENEQEDSTHTSMVDAQVAFKYRFWGENDSRALALEAGILLPMISESSYAVWEAGLIYSHPLSEKLRMDIDATYFVTTENEPGDPLMGTHANVSFCYYPADKWMIAAELNGYFYDVKGQSEDSWNLSPSLGVDYEINDTLSVQIYGQQDIPGLAANTELETLGVMQFTFAFGPKKQP